MPRFDRRGNHRRLYPVFIEFGLVASLLLVIGAFRADYSSSGAVDYTSPPVDVVPLVPVPPTDLTLKPPPPPRPQVPVVVPDDEELENDVIEINPEIHPDDPPPAIHTPPQAPDDDGDEIIDIWGADQEPEPVGGPESILSRLTYPEIARKAGVEGRVTIEFVVEKDGTVSDAEVIKGIGAGCDEAALRALLDTRFTPGVQHGRLVRVKMTIPIVFKIK